MSAGSSWGAAFGLLVAAATVVALAVVTQDDGPPPVDRPNVVLVLGCTLRADQLGPWGGVDGVTPHIDAVARQGTRFARTIAQGMWTRPGSAAVLLGRQPFAVGLPEPGPGRNDRRVPADATLLAERFAGAGYETIGVTGNSNLNPVFGFDQGFDVYQGTELLWRDGQKKVEGATLVRDALGLVDARTTDAPLYLQVVLLDAHQPVTVDQDEIAAFSRPGVPRRVAAYRAMLRRFDAAVAALDDGLRARGYDETNTLFLLVGDHGEGLDAPPHHGPGHGNFLYPSVAVVPWLVRGPGVPARRTVHGLSAQIDVVPTVIGMAGLEADPSLDGHDLSAQVRGRASAPRRRVYTETWFQGSERAAFYTNTWMCQRDYAGQGLPEGCFDLRADPECRRPLPDPATLRALDEAHAAARATLMSFGAGDRMQVDAALKGQLEALGYLE